MRINRQIILGVVHDTISKRARENRRLLAVYLCGSMLEPGENYLLGGSADVDLVFIHADSVPIEREIVRLTDEVHMDIAHHLQKDYRQPRYLRMHPWMGPTLNACRVLYDPQHFMDFTQASVRGQFDRSDRVLRRSRIQVERARQIWLSYYTEKGDPGPSEIAAYLRAVEHAGNAIASITGPPLTERRFLLDFPGRAQAIGRPGLYAGLLGLLGAPKLTKNALGDCFRLWQATYEAISPGVRPARLHPNRRHYYQKAFETFLSGDQPEAIMWPMLRTWTLAVNALTQGEPIREAWYQVFGQLGLLGTAFEERIDALDAYLDLVEEVLEEWARENGVWVP